MANQQDDKGSAALDNMSVAEQEPEWLHYGDPRMDWYGLPAQTNPAVLCRLPEELLPSVSERVKHLARCASGARVRFRTDSRFLRLEAVMEEDAGKLFIDRGGISGFDMYCSENGRMSFCKLFLPEPQEGTIKGEYVFQRPAMKDVLIHFPLFAGIHSLRLGLEPGAEILKSEPYGLDSPLVLYGSSITQGAHASRPGNSYPLLLSRWLNLDIRNLGFSGAARGEQIMADYIAGLQMCGFVLDYDHNAPSAEYLAETHYRFYEIVRQAHPLVPVILVSRPDFDLHVEDSVARRAVVRGTYEQGRGRGDRNLWFVDGELLFGTEERDACTTDTCHPNDLGFLRMARTLLPVLQQALGLE